jgi:unsaturated rhamnogalacturonyl hydrolase
MRLVRTIRERWKRKRPASQRYPWQNADPGYFDAVRRAARCQLAAATPAERRVTLFGRNGSSAPRKNRNTWPNACLAQGLWAAYRVWGDRRDLEAVVSFLDAILDAGGAFADPLEEVGQCMIGTVLIDLVERCGENPCGGETRYRRAIDVAARFLLEEHVRTASGTLPYTPRVPSLVLVDTLAMVCPFLAACGERFNVAGATDLAAAQLDEFLAQGLHRRLGLPYHGFQVQGPPDLGMVGWARGTGWLAMALVDTLAALPAGHEARPRLAGAVAELARAIRPFQTADGVWRWALPAPGGLIDTSGTAMLGYAVEKAVTLEVLEDGWHELSERALTGVARRTREDGRVDKALGECIDVGLYPATTGPAPWAQGPAVALTALVLGRRRAHAETALAHGQ